MRLIIFSFIILSIDQLSKSFILAQVDLPWWLISKHIGFNIAMNPGIAFSLPIGENLSLALSSVLLLFILYFVFRYVVSSFYSDLSFAFIIGAAFGNIVDRFRFHAVVDFISVYSYPVFNLADVFIVFGVFLLFIWYSKIFSSSRSFTPN